MRVLALTSFVLMLSCNGGGSSHALFEFTDGADTFVFELRDPAQIAHARRILSGEEKTEIHITGLIVSKKADYNASWSLHLAPDSIEFFEVAMEVCDSSIQHVEDHLEEVGGSFLPGNRWCPWSSKLTGEL